MIMRSAIFLRGHFGRAAHLPIFTWARQEYHRVRPPGK
jgi:hypothetical protein